jgi:quercetin dioxygenase-like cupin family protein
MDTAPRESARGPSEAARGVVKKAGTVELRPVSAGRGTEIQVLLGEQDGAPSFAMRRFIMERGGGMPLHSNEVEHEQYVLQGRARIVIGDESHDVAAGDVLYIPAGTPHSYTVVEGPFEFLCMVPNRPDRIRFHDE